MVILTMIAGVIALLFVGVAIINFRDKRELAKYWKARDEYDKIINRYGLLNAPDHCPHRIVQIGQTGVPGVVTMTSRWCKICGKYLGAAH
jgi:hypothetical protein